MRFGRLAQLPLDSIPEQWNIRIIVGFEESEKLK
jgi:hypothetical protein